MNLPTLEEMAANAQSSDPDVRARAIQALWIRVQKEPDVGEFALPIFRSALIEPTDGWTVSNALRGVQRIAGEREFRTTAIELANYSPAPLASRVVLMLSDPSCADALIELMRRRPDNAIQISAMRTLGSMHEPAALDPLVANLQNPALRPHAIESLRDLGDSRAIAHLEPFLNDTAKAWQEDNHGPMLYVRDLAQTAILRLRTPLAQPASIPQTVAHPTASPAIPSAATSASPVAALLNEAKTPGSPMRNIFAFAPLVLAILQIPWILLVIFAVVVMHDTLSKNHAATRLLDLIAMLPGLIGFAIGLFFFTRRPGGLAERICLILGTVGCALPLYPFGYEFFH